jgi:hypothetical protein
MAIPCIYDEYNYNINTVDKGNQLAANNTRLRLCRRGGWQAIEHWLLRIVLVNCYIIAYWAGSKDTRSINFRSQVNFRSQLIDLFLFISKDLPRSNKKRISYISYYTNDLLISEYQKKHIEKRRQYVICKGLRLSDRPQKRIILGEIVCNKNRPSKTKNVEWACI